MKPYFEDEFLTLFNVDCLSAMEAMSDKCFDLAICDPPFGIGESNSKFTSRIFRKSGERIVKTDNRNGASIFIPTPAYNENKSWDDSQPSQNYFDELFRVSKNQLIFGCNYLTFDQKKNSSGRIFWDKVNGTNDFSDGELIWSSLFKSVRQVEYLWNGMLQAKSIFEPRTTQGNQKLKERRIHPTQKPVELYKYFLQNHAKPGQTILDTHCGSLSSAIACSDFRHHLTAFELDADYCAAAVKRYQNHRLQQNLFAECAA